MTVADKQIRYSPSPRQLLQNLGDVIALKAKPDMIINQGMCGRYHNMAQLEFAKGGQVGISLFDATPRVLPYKLDMMERHPKGSQAFVPMHDAPFLVIVADG